MVVAPIWHDRAMNAANPKLSVVVTAREGLDEVSELIAELTPQAESVGAEIVVVGGAPGPAPVSGAVRHVPLEEDDILRLRARGVAEARGEVVAIGEDHAFPAEGWCEAVIRAHEENPDVASIAGCLVNATAETISGRANFLAFAAPWQPPMPELPPHRPPPASAMSFKRSALAETADAGSVEARVMPTLFERGQMAADDRIVVNHHQDHGVAWAIRNGFDASRSSYGYLSRSQAWREQLATARRVARYQAPLIISEARAGPGARRRADVLVACAIAVAVAAGGIVGALAGPARSPRRVA
jgi:hypothetical protein